LLEGLKTLIHRIRGIKETYPLIPLSMRVRSYIRLIRPMTILGAFLSGLFLDIFFSRLSPNGINFIHATLVGLSLASIHIFGQVLNQSIREEVEIDRINSKMRPTVTGALSLKEAKRFSLIWFIFGTSIAFYLNPIYGIFSLLIAFFAVAYTIPPFRIKRFFLFNNLWQGIARGLLPAVYVSSAYNNYGLLPIIFGVSLMIWITGAQASKDWGDTVGDRFYNIKTFPVVLGFEGTLKLMGFLMGISFLMFNLFIYLRIFPSVFLVLNLLIIPSSMIILGLKHNIKLSFAENNLSWVCFYGTLGLFYMLPALII